MVATIWEPTLPEESIPWRDKAAELTREHFRPLAAELDKAGRYPWESVARLVDCGLASLTIPKKYGGSELSLTTTCAVVEAVSEGCASTGAILSAFALGVVPLVLAANDEQKDRYLPKVAAGEAVSFALTEVGAGSDASAVKTTAVREGDAWRIRGEKVYIGNGGASRYYLVFAKTERPTGGHGLTAFLVDREAQGVTIDRYEAKMGIRGTMTSNLKLDTVVGDEDVIGEENRGLRLALGTLNIGRISVAAQAVGVALAATKAAVVEASRREAFGQKIIDHQGIGFRLADAAVRTSSARMLTYEAARIFDAGGDVSILGAMAKLAGSEAAHHAVDAAVQVFGGDGYCEPFLAERLYRDQRILEIYEGTSEIQRLVISRSLKSEADAYAVQVATA